ncbi:uncharacterized protein [Nicotiana sylvestris]|uniref:Uncharacterized protein LOC104235338 n=1 Tax=Nicotiana sylvestris TaxID=4096 RepID=A0A1U7XCJ4_NICSY|nr:PREDICTED: uncharacterized protein LOC104235338 [Nicotiana sylvestris]
MEYERIHKVQNGILSPSKLRMKLIGAHNQKKKEGSNSNSSRTSPARLEDSEFVKNSLLATQSGDFEDEYSNIEVTANKLPGNSLLNSSQGDETSNSCLPKETSEAARAKRQQFSKIDGGNSSSVHPVKGCEDENIDYDSTSSFEFHKGERSMHHHSMTTRSFSRPMSSKWNDAEKWIMNRQNVQANYSKKVHLQNQAHRGPAASMVRVAPESSGYESKLAVKKVDFCQPANQIVPEKFAFDQPGSHSQGNGANAVSLDLCPESKDLTEVVNRDSSCTKSLTEDRTVLPAIRSVSMRDMGTEMTPIPSQEPSRTATPVDATTPIRSPTSSIPSTPRRGEPAPTPTENCIGNASQNSTENNKKELSEEELKMKTRKEIVALGVQLGKMNIAAWASKDEKDKSEAEAAEVARMEYAKRAAAWEEAEKSKHSASYKREEIKIQAWESQQKAKLEAEMRKIEAQVEQMRAQAQAKMVKKIAMARQRSEEKRAAAEARRNQQAEKTTEQVEYIRQTGRLPSSSFSCCGWL